MLPGTLRRALQTAPRWQLGGRRASTLRLVAGACCLPHPDKVKGGEDAFFIHSSTVGVADGVGGWARKGIDSGEYSRSLMKCAAHTLENCTKQGLHSVSPMDVLKLAHRRVKCLGSSTACIVQLQGDKLNAINLGDSGFLVYRRMSNATHDSSHQWMPVFESSPQTHFFNCPFQLSSHESTDLPERGQMIELDAVEGDVLILATDGLLDNLFPDQIGSVLDEVLASPSEEDLEDLMQTLATRIAQEGQQKAKSSKLKTPFAIAAQKAGYKYLGGKMDDITVVAGRLVRC